MAARTYSDEQIQDFHKEYLVLQNLSLVAFSKKKCLISSVLRTGFKRLGLEIIPQSITRRKFPINENFFESIDTEEKAYFLGFLYADACNAPSKNRLEVALAKQDRDILEVFSRTILCGNVNIREYKAKKKGAQDRVAVYIINKKISQDLVKWGCISRKTFFLQFPPISPGLYGHFVRGYFDGDGSLTFSKRTGTTKKDTNFSIVSTKEMLQFIQNLFSKLDVNSYINKRHKNRKNNNFTLRVFGNRQIKKVCDWLYIDANVYLQRKYNHYINLVNLMRK